MAVPAEGVSVRRCCPSSVSCTNAPLKNFTYNVAFHDGEAYTREPATIRLGDIEHFSCPASSHHTININNLYVHYSKDTNEYSPWLWDAKNVSGRATIPWNFFCVSADGMGDNVTLEAHYCEHPCFWSSLMYRVFQATSCVALLVTLALYLLSRKLKKQRGLHSWSVMNMVAAQFLSILFDLISFYLPETVNNEHFCFAIALVAYGTTLAFPCWLSVVSFDMWRKKWTQLDGQNRVFAVYCGVAWGGPAAAVLVAGLLEKYGQSVGAVVPGFLGDIQYCWFKDGLSVWLYLRGPATALLVTNVILFVLGMVRVLRKFRADIRSNQNRTSLRVRLSFAMAVTCGVVWVLQLYFLGEPHHCSPGVVAVNLLCSSQGVMLLGLVLCNIHRRQICLMYDDVTTEVTQETGDEEGGGPGHQASKCPYGNTTTNSRRVAQANTVRSTITSRLSTWRQKHQVRDSLQNNDGKEEGKIKKNISK